MSSVCPLGVEPMAGSGSTCAPVPDPCESTAMPGPGPRVLSLPVTRGARPGTEGQEPRGRVSLSEPRPWPPSGIKAGTKGSEPVSHVARAHRGGRKPVWLHALRPAVSAPAGPTALLPRWAEGKSEAPAPAPPPRYCHPTHMHPPEGWGAVPRGLGNLLWQSFIQSLLGIKATHTNTRRQQCSATAH